MWSICERRRGAGLRWALALVFVPMVTFAYDRAQAWDRVNDLYVVESGLNQVVVVETSPNGIPNKVVATIPVGNIAAQARTTPNNAFVWVTNAGDATVTAINTHSKAATTFSIGVPNSDFPALFAFSPSGDKAYIADEGTNLLTIVDVNLQQVIANVAVGTLPAQVAVTPDGSKVYVANLGDSTVSVLDTESQTVTATINIPCGSLDCVAPNSPPSPTGIAVSPDGRFVYVTDAYDFNLLKPNDKPYQSTQVTIIRVATNRIVKTISNAGGFAGGSVCFSADGSRAFVANGGNDDFPDNRIGVINTSTQTLTRVITEPTPATGASEVDPAGWGGGLVYVANFGTGSGGESVVTLSNTQVSAFTLPAGSFPQSLAVVPVDP